MTRLQRKKIANKQGTQGKIKHSQQNLLMTYLEVVRQLGSAGVTGIHGNKHRAAWDESDLSAFEDDRVLASIDAALDGQNLLRHHRQHFQVDAVELVEARPSTAGGKTFEELTESLVVQAV